MNSTELKEGRYLAGRMETCMNWVAGIGVGLGLFAMLDQRWPVPVTLLLLSALAYASARLFGLAAVVLARLDPNQEP